MRSRQTPLKIFSTFLQFAGDRPSTWATDARLRRSMQRCLTESTASAPSAEQPQGPASSSAFWALYWHQAWQAQATAAELTANAELNSNKGAIAQALATNHLTAYLQEPCFWAAQKILVRFSTTQFTLSDCFQIGIAQVAKVLAGFNPKQGFSLQNYASAVFTSGIRDMFRQQREVDICSPWALLRKISQTRLEAALRSRGLNDTAVAQHLLAWTGFKTLYVPTQASATRQLPKPDADTLQAIAQFYQAQAQAQTAPLPAPRLTLEWIEQCLSTCAQAARAYLNPTVLSMNTPRPGQESGEILDDLPASPQSSLLADLIDAEDIQERQQQQQDLATVLTTAIAQLDDPSQSLIRMYYGESLTQQDIAQRLDMKQYTVSRRLTRARDQLLTAIAHWSQHSLHISLTPDLLSTSSTLLEDWLQRHFE
jgi:RNA polymerase sigma factor (sigma-70 family)